MGRRVCTVMQARDLMIMELLTLRDHREVPRVPGGQADLPGRPRSGPPAGTVAVCGLGGVTSSVASGLGETGDVPRGLYRLRDRDGTVVGYERFSCAPGPVGWRYNAQVLAPDGGTPADRKSVV